MTTHLYLLRHGIAVPHGAPELPDDERPLTPQGEKRMKQIGRGLRALDVTLDRIVSSPLPRALKTAEIVADALGAEDLVETADALRADRDALSIHEWLKTRAEDRLMVVGHNPWISELVGLLVTGHTGATLCELGKGGVAAFRAQPPGGMLLDWLARPRLLRRLSS